MVHVVIMPARCCDQARNYSEKHKKPVTLILIIPTVVGIQKGGFSLLKIKGLL